MVESVQDRYFKLLKACVARPEEKHLFAASELGRELVRADVPPEDIAVLHEEALRRLTEEAPAILLRDVVQPTAAPLMELLMAYGLTYRQQLETRKQAEQALRESEERYRTLFETAPIGLGVADADGNLLAYNTAMLAPGGYAPEDIAEIGNVANLYFDSAERAKVLTITREQGFLHQHEMRLSARMVPATMLRSA